MKILCLGHVTYDTTLPIDKYPLENKKYRTDRRIECGGGPASNAAYLLAKWKMDVNFAGIVGNDYYGQMVKEEFRKIGVGITYLEEDNLETSSSYIIANTSNGSRTILTAKTPKSSKLEKSIKEKYDMILLDGEHVDSAMEVLENNKDAISILDAGSFKDETVKLGTKVSILACSKNFAEDFAEEKINADDYDSLIRIYKKLEKRFNTQIIITLEDKGSFVKINDKYEIISSIKVKALDSTGAGDIFHGALAYFIANHYPLEQAIALANISGALSVKKIGSRMSMPELKEVLEIGKKYNVL